MTRCAANLRCLASAMYIYVGADGYFPQATLPTRAGDLNLFAYRNKPPGKDDAPSPSADLWLLELGNNSSTNFFVCPATTDQQDPIADPSTVYDFAGPQHLSYAYVYQYHPDRPPLGVASDYRLPLMADANPYLKGGVPNPPKFDRQSSRWGGSMNHHEKAGQNVAFVDSHVSFVESPSPGPYPADKYAPALSADNIYTTHADNEPADPGNAPTWTRIQIGSKSDYCLVP